MPDTAPEITIDVPVILRINVPVDKADDAGRRAAAYIEHGSVRDGLYTAFEDADYEIEIDALYVSESSGPDDDDWINRAYQSGAVGSERTA